MYYDTNYLLNTIFIFILFLIMILTEKIYKKWIQNSKFLFITLYLFKNNDILDMVI